MACAGNFRKKDSHYSNINYKIPCRYCLNCRVDKRNEWEVRANYEFKQKISGAFVTFTYDNNHLYNILKLGNDGKIRPTLKYKDAKKFIQRLRKKIINMPEKWSALMRPDFTYLGVGEYGQNGELFDRPHFHILFFGLDHKYCEKLFYEEWQNGFIDSLPILAGGIRYVLKYMDKQIMGKENQWEQYGRYRLERPKQFQSKGLGSEIYQEKWESGNIKNGMITDGIREYPIPMYYRNKLGIFTSERENNDKKVKRLQEYYNIKKINNPNRQIKWHKYEMEKEELAREYQTLVERREEILYQKMLKGA